MPSQYTTSLKLQEIANGEQSGIWGTTTNNNLNLIEQAITGVTTINMGNQNYTLSNLNGVPSDARNAVIVATGTNSAIRQIIAPLAQKFYVVSNKTTGGFDITIGGSTGALVAIKNGVTAQVYCNGTDFYSAQTGSAGDFAVDGNLTVDGNTTISGSITVYGSSNIVPTGSLLMWPSANAPAGYLLCNGAAVSTATYSALFAVIGYTFGYAGENFLLPNYTNRMPYGTTLGATGGSANAIVVSHNHGAYASGQDQDHSHSGTTGYMNQNNVHSHTYPVGGSAGGQQGFAYYGYNQIGAGSTSAVDINHTHSFSTGGVSANHSHVITVNAAGSDGTNANLPPYLGINFIIKI